MAKKRTNYINNPDFLQAMIDYRTKVAEAKDSGKPKPQVPPYIGECFMKIATRLSHKPNFINYDMLEVKDANAGPDICNFGEQLLEKLEEHKDAS